MLTAVIRAETSASALAATFSVLIPAVAEGFLGHAVVVATEPDAEVERLADATGAVYLIAGTPDIWRRGADQARGDWLLLLQAGDVPQPHWAQVVDRHLMLAPDRPALIARRDLAAAWRERVSLALNGRELRAGLVLPKRQGRAGRLEVSPRRLDCRRERAL